MVGKNATPLIGWHSADPDRKQRLQDEAERRGITLRELLDEMTAEQLEHAEQLKAYAETHYQDATGWHRKHDVYGGPHDEPPSRLSTIPYGHPAAGGKSSRGN